MGTLVLDRALSAMVAGDVEAIPRQCYRNAVMALLCVDAVASFTYVEGVAVYADTSVPIEHAWLQRGDRVVDPTAVLLTEHAVSYYPGATYDHAEVARRATRETLPLTPVGDVRMMRGWRACWEQLLAGSDDAATRKLIGQYDRAIAEREAQG